MKVSKMDRLWVLFWAIAFSIIGVCCMVVDCFAGDKWLDIVVSSDSIPSTTTLDDCDVIDAYGIRQMAVTVRFSFNVAGGSDVTCGWYTSPDNVNWDTDPIDTITYTLDAGALIQVTDNLTPDAMYHKFLLNNSDSVHAISGATITVVGSD